MRIFNPVGYTIPIFLLLSIFASVPSADPFAQTPALKRVGRHLSFHLPSNPFSDISDSFSSIVHELQGAPFRLFGNDSPFHNAFPGFDSNTIHLPFDGLINSLVKKAQAPMDISLSPDGAWVHVKVNLQQMDRGRRKVQAKVVGSGRHLQVTIKTENMEATHTVGLPRKVTGKDMKMEGNEEDQSVLLKLKVSESEEGEGATDGTVFENDGGRESFLKEWLGSSGILGELLGLGGNEGHAHRVERQDERENVRHGAQTAGTCAHKFGGDPLKIKRCECETAESDGEKSLCYASLVSSGVKMMRRLGLRGVSSEMKHEALACADGASEQKTQCLKVIVNKLMTAVNEQKGLSKRIRAEIEGAGDDADRKAPSSSHHASSKIPAIGVLVLLLSLVGLVLWLLAKERRFVIRHPVSGLTSRLSSALTMVTNLADGNSRPMYRTKLATGQSKREAKVMKD